MSTIGEREVETMDQRRERVQRMRHETRWQRRGDAAVVAGMVLGAIGLLLGALFGVVYLVTLAVRLAWGS